MNNLPPFYVGQRVICVDKNIKARTNDIRNEEIILDHEYLVGECGYNDLGFIKYWYIMVGGMQTKWDAKSFTPTQENFQSISLSKILEKETKLIGVN